MPARIITTSSSSSSSSSSRLLMLLLRYGHEQSLLVRRSCAGFRIRRNDTASAVTILLQDRNLRFIDYEYDGDYHYCPGSVSMAFYTSCIITSCISRPPAHQRFYDDALHKSTSYILTYLLTVHCTVCFSEDNVMICLQMYFNEIFSSFEPHSLSFRLHSVV